jgi:hypothetical protein
MIRAAALVALFCTAALALAGWGPGASSKRGPVVGAGVAGPGLPELRPQVLETRACKPQAPLEVHLVVLPVPGEEGLLRVQAEIVPRIGMGSVRWSLDLPDGLSAEGAREGVADARAQVATRVDLVLRVSPKLASRLAAGQAGADELVLDVLGTLPDSGGAEGLSRRSVVRLSPAATPADAELPEAPVRHFVDADSGARTRMAVLPSLHRSGR